MLPPERSILNSGATSNESNAHVDFEQRKVSLETRLTLSAKLMLPWYLQGMSSQRFATKSDNF